MSDVKICPTCSSEYPPTERFCPRDGSPLRNPGNAGGDITGEVIAGSYHILKKLGEGGMGQVYLAEHVKMGRKSALKIMHPSMVHDADAISRFNREAANASRISHPHVAQVYDFGETPDGLIYLAMEFVDGEPLTSLIERHGALAPARAAEITRQTAEALAVAHDYGIVHRDLKPDNIMIARGRDAGDMVKVVDFGIAKAGQQESQKVTKTGLVVGTPEYMSPEQLAGDGLDGRSDLYSLALVTFNMLTGTLPFPSTTAQESMIMRLTDRPRTLAEMRPDVAWPPQLQAVMDRALQRDAGERYRTTAEFGRDLVRAVGAMPDLAPRAAVADAGTQVLSPSELPMTNVNAAGGRPTPAAAPVGATMPTPAVAAPAAAALPDAPPRRRAPVAAMTGAALGVVGLAFGAYLVFGDSAGSAGAAGNAGAKDVVVPDSSSGAEVVKPGNTVGPAPGGAGDMPVVGGVERGPSPSSAAASRAAAVAPRPTELSKSSESGMPATTPAGAGGSGETAEDAADDEAVGLDMLTRMADASESQQRQALARVSRAASRARDGSPRALRARFARAVLLGYLEDERACDEMRAVRPQLRDPEPTALANEFLRVSCP